MGMNGAIARWYAGLTKKSLTEFESLAQRIARELPPPRKVLEVAPGPGYFAIALAKLGAYAISGLDISEAFVTIARTNAREAGVHVDFRQGNASQMPFADNTFDFLLCRAAFKNFTEPVRALEEMRRVLRPAAHAIIIDLRRDASVESIDEAVSNMHLGTVNAWITRLTFRQVLLKRAYTRAEFRQMSADAGFRHIDIKEDLIGLEVQLIKDGDIAAGNDAVAPCLSATSGVSWKPEGLSRHEREGTGEAGDEHRGNEHELQ
jgi:ubiquinone/menaquinone biosynthesis C-methylase UbiE